MTPERITAIYAQLETMTLPFADVSVQRGPDHLLDQLAACRRMQDEASQLLVEVLRAIAVAKQQRRAARTAEHLMKVAKQTTSSHYVTVREEREQAEDHHDALDALRASIAYTRGNLRNTDSGIRLSAALLDTQLKLGQVPPPKDMPLAVAPLEDAPDTPTAPMATDVTTTTPTAVVESADDLSAFYASVRGGS